MTVAMPGTRRPFLPSEGERRIAQALKTVRTSKRLTQAEVAKRIGVSTQTLLRYEKLERSIPTGQLLALQELLGPLGPSTMALADRTLGPVLEVVGDVLGRRATGAEAAATPDEERLVRIFRSLRPEKQYTLLRFRGQPARCCQIASVSVASLD